MKRDHIFLVLKIGVTAGLVYLLIDNIDARSVAQRIAEASLAWFAAALVLFAVLVAFGVVRWWLVLRAVTRELPVFLCTRLTLIGLFFNQTLPSTVGGDASRVFYTWRAGIDASRAFNSVMLDRVAGLVVLVVLATAILPVVESRLDDPLATAGLRLLIAAGWIAAIGLFIFDNPLTRRFERYRIAAFALELSRDARRVTRRPLTALGVVVSAAMVHVVTVAILWCLDRALGGNAPYTVYFLAMIPTLLVISIPVSIAGWGLREQSLVILLGSLGIAAEHAASVSILYGIVLLVGGLPGGLIWLVTRKQQAPDAPPPAERAA